MYLIDRNVLSDLRPGKLAQAGSPDTMTMLGLCARSMQGGRA
ncbi:MAG TPA: hypothetical protein PLK10_10965 [Ottowia sp.]|nr:hypothetical protein [Ottowia sp.]